MNIVRQIMKWSLGRLVPNTHLMLRGPLPGAQTHPGTVEPARPACEIALTFDDGPHPEHTPRLLDYLNAEGFRTTFFVVGQEVKRYPHIVRRIVDEGHEVGNHTWSHSEPNRTSTEEFLHEVAETRALLQDITGRDCTLMRPPKGKLTATKLMGLWRMKQTVVLWNVDPRDYAMQVDTEMSAWCESYVPNFGDIVLMHDNHPFASSAIEELGTCSDAGLLHCRRLSDWLTNNANHVMNTPTDISGVSSQEFALTVDDEPALSFVGAEKEEGVL